LCDNCGQHVRENYIGDSVLLGKHPVCDHLLCSRNTPLLLTFLQFYAKKNKNINFVDLNRLLKPLSRKRNKGTLQRMVGFSRKAVRRTENAFGRPLQRNPAILEKPLLYVLVTAIEDVSVMWTIKGKFS
jgi:hypothetical protein